MKLARTRSQHSRPWLVRVVNPGVPWWVVLPCNVLAGLALILLALNPDENPKMALLLLGPAAIALYGTALVLSWGQRRLSQ